MFSRRRTRRAVTDMTASYAPLRDMTAVYEELSVKFVTPEGTQFDAWICFEEGNNMLKLWVQDHNLHAESLRVNDFIWIAVKRCTSTGGPCKVLFGRKPLYEGQTCMQLLFQNVKHLELFMHRIQPSAQATV